MDSYYNGYHSERSPILQDATFGQSKVTTSSIMGYTYAEDKLVDARILTGRWKDQKVTMNPFPQLASGYGYMHSAWDRNPSPYVSRFINQIVNTTFSSCRTHWLPLRWDSSLTYFMFDVSNAGHADTHFVLGGLFGCDALLWLYDDGYTATLDDFAWVCYNWGFFLMKVLYRGNILARDSCALPQAAHDDPATFDYNSATCPFTCSIDSFFLINYIPLWFTQYTNDADGHLGPKLAAFICGGNGSRIHLGDQLESSAPMDPSFWLIHPTIERLVQAKLSFNGFEEEYWPTDMVDDFVCLNSYCFDEELATWGYHPSCCNGHNAKDRMYDGVVDSLHAFTGDKNGEVLIKSDPRTDRYSQHYIYENFDWDHCTTVGWNINSLLQAWYANDTLAKQQDAPSNQPNAVQDGNRMSYQHKSKEVLLEELRNRNAVKQRLAVQRQEIEMNKNKQKQPVVV